MRIHPSSLRFTPTVPLTLFVIFLAVLWIAGGGSRADVAGQVVVRAGCWGILALATLLAPRPRLNEALPVALLLSAAIILAAMQLVPLPPALWQALPGRAMLTEAATASGQSQPWRAWSMVPGATVNALSSLVVPLTSLVLITTMTERERDWLPSMLLGCIALATLLGLLQFSGAILDNPLINDTPGEIGGIFANRNHFALFLAIGCVLAPVWAFRNRRQLNWRGPLAIGLVLLFVLAILATGSRAGVVLGAGGLVMGLLIVAKPVRSMLRRAPRWMIAALVAGAGGLIALVLASVLAGRAVSIDRILSTDIGQDMRSRGLPTVLSMIGDYFPFGSGLGGFDTIFRIHEPFALLKPTYFNHAHNDWLEILLDTGIVGGMLLSAATLWWGWASIRAWRSDVSLPKLGSAILLLVLGASAFDYPARTPMIMAVMVLAGIWLNRRNVRDANALPGESPHL